MFVKGILAGLLLWLWFIPTYKPVARFLGNLYPTQDQKAIIWQLGFFVGVVPWFLLLYVLIVGY